MLEANEMRLELIPLPVDNVNRAKAFYVEKIGFHLDHDVQPSATMRVVQLTPPGSACSIVIGTSIVSTPPGSIKGLHLVVKDIHQICQQLQERGVEVSAVEEYPQGIKMAYFSDPDGNSWVLQELPPK